jgi:hypothetical protein
MDQVRPVQKQHAEELVQVRHPVEALHQFHRAGLTVGGGGIDLSSNRSVRRSLAIRLDLKTGHQSSGPRQAVALDFSNLPSVRVTRIQQPAFCTRGRHGGGGSHPVGKRFGGAVRSLLITTTVGGTSGVIRKQYSQKHGRARPGPTLRQEGARFPVPAQQPGIVSPTARSELEDRESARTGRIRGSGCDRLHTRGATGQTVGLMRPPLRKSASQGRNFSSRPSAEVHHSEIAAAKRPFQLESTSTPQQRARIDQ